MKLDKHGVGTVASCVLAFIGIYVLCGWALGQEAMVRILPRSVAMGVNAASMFIAAGLCLFPASANRSFSRVQSLLPWLLVILPCVILIEHSLDRGLGVDWQHSMQPSRMAIRVLAVSRPMRVLHFFSPGLRFCYLLVGKSRSLFRSC